jgi:Bacterial regulatory helix-turn-helix protein, lysR family
VKAAAFFGIASGWGGGKPMHAGVLQYLDQVARVGSIRPAAEKLNVASSAVNRQILKPQPELRGRPGAVPEFAGGRIFRKQSPRIRFG